RGLRRCAGPTCRTRASRLAGLGACGTRPFAELLAAVDPRLHADAAVGGVRVHDAVADVRAQRAQRDATLAVPLGAAHLRAAQATRDLHLDALGARLDGALDGLLHRLADGDAPLELTGLV